MPVRERTVSARQLGLASVSDLRLPRTIPIEAPVAMEFNGIGYAVMMATPADLRAYAIGFALTEDLATSIDDFLDISEHQVGDGWIVRTTLPPEQLAKVTDRARTRVSESSCGLCGLESIEAVLRPLPPVGTPISTSRAALAAALSDLRLHQPLNAATGAVHAAAFCSPGGTILHACEDVGRHNALDKLIGTLALGGVDTRTGFVLLSARCSYELVEKAVRAGFPMLVTVSAPTSLAVERAIQSGLTLIALARADSVLVLNDPRGSFW